LSWNSVRLEQISSAFCHPKHQTWAIVALLYGRESPEWTSVLKMEHIDRQSARLKVVYSGVQKTASRFANLSWNLARKKILIDCTQVLFIWRSSLINPWTTALFNTRHSMVYGSGWIKPNSQPFTFCHSLLRILLDNGRYSLPSKAVGHSKIETTIVYLHLQTTKAVSHPLTWFWMENKSAFQRNSKRNFFNI
jgi:hypothetical protein